MKKKVLFAISLPLILLFESCSKEVEYTTIPELSQVVSPIGGEEKAIETFNNFIEKLNGSPQTKSTIVPTAKVISVRKTTVSTYGSNLQTKSNGENLPVYELTRGIFKSIINMDYILCPLYPIGWRCRAAFTTRSWLSSSSAF
jgi:hypothetical protein